MVHEERRIRNALQTQHEMKEFSFETEEYCNTTRLVRGRIALESRPFRAPQPPPGRAERPPTHPYYPNARPYVGVWPDSTTTQRTKFHTRTQFDGASTKHAHNLSKSGLNGIRMLQKPPRDDVVALLDHARRRKRPSPLPLRTPQRGCELEGRRGERKRRPRARGGQKAWVAHPSGSRPTALSLLARAIVR